MGLLGDLHQRGKTILMVTHEPEIAACAGMQLHMRDGRVDRVQGSG
jgi:putative ABC transport system ATP-binding protein